MFSFKGRKATFTLTTLGLPALLWLTACHQGGEPKSYGTVGTRVSEPSGGGATVAEERPGAGVGAQTSMGASADVPEATQKGAGASDLTTPNESASGSSGAGSAGAQAQATPTPSSPPPPSGQSGSTVQLSGNQTSTNMAIPLYQEKLQVGKREVPEGAVRIRKYVQTETVNQPVQIRREQVTVDRVPSGGQAAQGTAPATAANAPQSQPFQEQEITIQLHREEPIISKQVQPAGEVVANVQTQMQQTNVQGQVRREQIQVTKEGNPQNVIIGQNVTSSGGATEAMGGSSQPGTGQGQGAGASGGTLTDPTALTGAQDPNSLAGRQANLSGLKVEQVIGQHLVELSDNSGKPLYVHVNQPVQNLKKGDTVNLTGTINRVPSDPTSMGLDQQASQALQDQSVYVDAQQIQPANQ